MAKKTFAIRGAINILKDTKDEVVKNSVELINEIISKNDLKPDEIVSVFISSTWDIQSYYPAKAIREKASITAPLFSCCEPDIVGSMKLCIRYMVTVEKNKKFVPKHIYLKSAKSLRTDL